MKSYRPSALKYPTIQGVSGGSGALDEGEAARTRPHIHVFQREIESM